MAAKAPASQQSSECETQLLEDEFQFVLCEGCQQESPNLKLLTCLHTLCLGCLSENKPIGQCPICQTAIPQASGIPDRDNLLFTSLQARLSIYKKIVARVDLFCNNCKREGEFWCFECEEFLCIKCFEAHQRYLKRDSHKAKRVTDVRAGSARDFLKGTRKASNLSCSNVTHKSQTLSIYCKKCCKPVCCVCALLEGKHVGQHCDINTEIQLRQEELSTMSRELKQRKSGFEDAYKALQDEVAHLEQVSRETREQIQQRVEQLVRLIRQEEEELLGLVETRREQGRRELAGELRRVEGVLRRMEAGERLVEKMSLYATEQEVMDMQPFIKDSLEELRRLQPTAAGGQVQATRDFAECRDRLQALAERVMGQTGSSAPQHDSLCEEASTPILNLELQSPWKQTQLHRCVPAGLPAHGHEQPRAPISDPSSSRGHVCPGRGGDASPAQPISPDLARQRNEEMEDDSGSPVSAHGDTAPIARNVQDSLVSLQEDFGAWARSNVQQADELLKASNHLLQAQQRANRHLLSMARGVRAMSCSLDTIASAMGPLLQSVLQSKQQPAPAVPSPGQPVTADTDWLSLDSNILELFLPSTSQHNESLFPTAPMASSPRRHPPSCPPNAADPPASPVYSVPPNTASAETLEGECPRSGHSTRGKRSSGSTASLRKRRK
ncbi:protein PML-like isoform X1 [Dromaius novaehollandiae]|uniref:protein PML-like isoform X1 n=1 Tax=Dromaius novaehollandiae TaxID=8790 RepID=UPI00311E489E